MSRTIPYLNMRIVNPNLNPNLNQIRVLRHPSRQPIRIEYYVTRELSAVVYKQAYDTSLGGRTTHHTRVLYPIQIVFLRKDARRKTQKIILCQWGYTGTKMWFYKNIFSSICQWGYTGTKMWFYKNIFSSIYQWGSTGNEDIIL